MAYSDWSTTTTYGPNGYYAGAGYSPIDNPAAYGSVPAGPPAVSTAPYNVPAAIGAGTEVYSQLPGYASALGNIGANIQSETAGAVPQDVIQQLQQAGAERNVTSGRIGSNTEYLKALGLTSLGLENTGLSQFESLLPMLPGASIATSPGQYTNPELQYQSALTRNIYGAAPQPQAAARANAAGFGAGYGAGSGGVRGGLPSTNYSYSNGIAPPAFADDTWYPSTGGSLTYGTPGYSDWMNTPWNSPEPQGTVDEGGYSYAPGAAPAFDEEDVYAGS